MASVSRGLEYPGETTVGACIGNKSSLPPNTLYGHYKQRQQLVRKVGKNPSNFICGKLK